MLGKHFTVESYQEGGQSAFKNKGVIVRRHYTIANCMKKEFYEELIRCLEFENASNTINNIESGFNMDLLNAEDQDTINITVKNY